VARLKEKGIGVLITDHNVRETLSITDRSYILYGGQILVSGRPTSWPPTRRHGRSTSVRSSPSERRPVRGFAGLLGTGA
jgi:ABC-type multidrug transport system ATPase subunit